MPDNLEPPTLSEVVRLINTLTLRIETMGSSYINRGEYNSDRQGIDLRFESANLMRLELSNDITELKGNVRVQAEQARDRNSKYMLMFVGAISTGIISIVINLVIKGVGM